MVDQIGLGFASTFARATMRHKTRHHRFDLDKGALFDTLITTQSSVIEGLPF